jgi:hypothetical protein
LDGSGRQIAKQPVLAVRTGETTLDNLQAVRGAHSLSAGEYTSPAT